MPVATLQHIEHDGHAIVPNAVQEDVLRHLDQALDAMHAGTRNPLGVPAVRELATSDPTRRLVGPVLGRDAFS